MAEEPQPSDIHEGAEAPSSAAASKEDRKAAQALSSLDAKADEDVPSKPMDMKALGEAMKNLELVHGAKKPADGGSAINSSSQKKEGEAPKKLIKVDPQHVSLVADQLDLSKPKATELLRMHDADPVKAMTAWVSSSA